jgi:hypothetical protein
MQLKLCRRDLGGRRNEKHRPQGPTSYLGEVDNGGGSSDKKGGRSRPHP